MAWFGRLRNVFRGDRVQRDLEKELAFHLRERIEELRESGLDDAGAARTARLQFGNFTAQVERTRDMTINTWLESVGRNLKQGVRVLLKTPAFTITVVLTLALGIGANSAVFSAIDAVLLRPLPLPDADRIMKIAQTQPRVGGTFVAPARLEDWNRLNRTFDSITGYYTEDVSESSGALPEKMKRARVAPRFFRVLGVSPSLGRFFSDAEEHFGGPRAVLISDAFWHRRFAGNPDVLEKTLTFQEGSYSIIGVLPPSFEFPDRDVDAWWLLQPDAPYARDRESTFFTAIGRLKAGVTVKQANDDLVAIQANLGRIYPKSDAVKSVSIQPLKEATVHSVKKSLWLLFASVSLLLLIACSNIAALLFSRAASRRHEISVRFTLGASRGAVAAQLFTEVLILAIVGALAGLLLAAGTSLVFRTLAKDLPRVEEIGLNWTIVLYSLACAVAVTLLCGTLPVMHGVRAALAGRLAQGGRSHIAGRNPVQSILVGVQVALAVTLLVGAGLLLRSFQELGRVSLGFDPDAVLVFRVSSTWAEAGGPLSRQRAERILDGMRAVPGVESAAVTSSLPGVPLDYQIEMRTVEGRADSEPKIMAQARFVTPEYFKVMRIPVLAGELCRDDLKTVPAMVNRSFADRYLSGVQAIGLHLAQPANSAVGSSEIRGIVGDAREAGVDRNSPPMVYVCGHSMQPGTYFLIRTHGDATKMASVIRRKVAELEPLRSVFDVIPLKDHISDAYSENRLRLVLLGFFALTAILLASIGLYGTLSYAAGVRRREVAVRMTLGALKGQVVRQFLSQGMVVAAAGCAAGLILAAAAGRAISSMLYGISATDAITLGGVAGLVLIVSALASLLPAVRAANLDPMRSLREE